MSINSTGIDKPTSVHICTHFKSSNREKSLFFYAKWTDGQIPLFPARENSSRPVRALHPDIYIYLIDLIKHGSIKIADLNEDKKRFVHQEQSNEDYFEGLNDYLNGTMSV